MRHPAERMHSVPPPDGGWGWVVMVASCIHAATLFGVLKSGGVLYVAIMNHLDVSRAQAALIPSLAFSVSCCMSLVSTSLCARFSIRPVALIGSFSAFIALILCAMFYRSYMMLVLCYGILMGLGAGCVMLPIVIIVHQYFDHHRAFASGFAMAGGAIGSVFIPPIFQFLLDEYGMFGALLILGGIMSHGCPMAMLYRPLELSSKRSSLKVEDQIKDPQEVALFLDAKVEVEDKESAEEEEGTPLQEMKDGVVIHQNGSVSEKTKEESSTLSTSQSCCARFLAIINLDPSVLKDPYFYVIGYSASCFAFTWISYLNIMPNYAEEEGEDVSASMAAFLISVTSFSDIIGRIAFGWISDRQWIERKHFFLLLLFFTGSALGLLSLASSYSSFLAGTICFGLFNGGCLIMPPILFNQFLGPKRFPAAWAVTTVLGGFIIFGATPSIAMVRDAVGSYKVCMILMGGSLISASLVWLVESIITRHRIRKNPTGNCS